MTTTQNTPRRRWPLRLVLAAVLVMPLVAGAGIWVEAQHGTEQVAALQARLDATQTSASQASTEARGDQAAAESTLSDADAALRQRTNDLAAVQELITTIFNWDDHDSYEAARKALVRVYGVAEDSELLTTQMPPDPVNTDAEGNTYPYIDAAGLNMSSGSSQTWLVSDSGSTRHYLTLVEVTATQSGYTSDTQKVMLTTTISGNGNAVRVSGVNLHFSLVN